MATSTALRAASTFPVAAGGSGGQLLVATGTYTLAANPTIADIVQMCRVPKNGVVVMGWYYGGDMDTNATETLDIDCGWAANGTDAADPDGFGNFGVFTGDAIAELKPEVSIFAPFGGVLRTAGPKKFAAETIITLTANAAAATFASVPLTVVALYFIDQNFSASNT